MLQLTQFITIFPANKEPARWVDHFKLLAEYGITTREQVAAFCSQIGHESLDMTVLRENLNYSEAGLLKVFPKYFDPLTAKALARRPEDIANVVYANRMGNGNTSSGDGWKYRGRGVIQLTGKSNYSACQKYMFGDENVLLDNPDQVSESAEIALKSAIWFWKRNSLDTIQDIRVISRRVNGGDHGMSDRVMRHERALKII